MKYILSAVLYFAGLFVLCAISLIAFEGRVLDISLTLTLVCWTFLYAYTDKLVLIYLNAREVIDTDEQELFQRIKNEVYKTNLPTPRVYTYQGSSSNCFIADSRWAWSIVIDKALLKSLKSSEVEALVRYAFNYRIKANALIQTKVMGLSSFTFLGIYFLTRYVPFILTFIFIVASLQFFIASNQESLSGTGGIILVFFGLLLAFFVGKNKSLKLPPKSIFFRVLSLVLTGLARPVFSIFDFLSKRKLNVEGSLALKPIVNRLEKNRYSYDQLMVDHFKEDFSIRYLILEHLESFPVLENCSFEQG